MSPEAGGSTSTGPHLAPEPAGDERLLERLLSGVTCTVVSAGWYRFPPDWCLPERVLPHYVAYVCVGGRAEVSIGGESHWLSGGTILLAPPDVPQEARNDPTDPVRFYTAHFLARLYGVLDMPALYRLPVVLRPAPARMAEIVEAARVIVGELAAGEAGCGLAANGACGRLVALLWRETVAQSGVGQPDHPSSGHASGAADVARLAPVFRAIQAGYAERLTLAELARVVHLNPAYFSAVFKQVTGLPPLRYLARFRLRQVRDLLVSTDQSVREIAVATGFRDPFYLSRVFRRTEGISPTEYRRSKKSPALP